MPLRFLVASIALAAFSTAQFADSCANALSGIVDGNGPATQCFDPPDLFTAVTRNTSSVVTPLNQWAISICDAQPCSNQTLAEIVDTVIHGCLSKFVPLAHIESPNSPGFSGLVPQLTSLLQQYYPTIRKAICMVDTSLVVCLTQLIESIQTVEGTITLDDLLLTLETGLSVSDFPFNVTCTDCNKAIYNILKQGIPSLSPQVTTDLRSTCGASFVDGAAPPSVSSVAVEDKKQFPTGGNTTGQGNGAGSSAIMLSGWGISVSVIVFFAVISTVL